MVRLVQGQCGLVMKPRSEFLEQGIRCHGKPKQLLVRGSAGCGTFCSIARSRVHVCGMSRPREFQLMEIRSMSCGQMECTAYILGVLVLTLIVVPIYQSGKVTYVSPDNDL